MGVTGELGDEWVKVEMISSRDEETWTREFLRDENSNIQLDATDWPRNFIQSVSADRELLRRWNVERSRRVVVYVRAWAEKNGISFADLVPSRKKMSISNTDLAKTQELDQRGVILAALQAMATDELLELNIKAKYLLKALDSRKPSR